MNIPELVLGAIVAAAAIAILHVKTARDEIHYAWLPAAFVCAMPAAFFAIQGSVLAAGALVGLVAASALCGYRSRRLARDHEHTLEDLAFGLGLRFARDDQTFASAAAWLADDVGRCVNVLSGTWRGAPVAVFQYRYLDTSDGEAPALRQLTCAATTVELEFRPMLVRPLSVREALRGLLRPRRATEPQVFERRFRIEAADPKQKDANLPIRTRAWLVANARGGKLVAAGHTVVLSVGHARADRVREVLDRIVELRATFT
ncbi:MAG TPA: hypothetical protein VM052_01495 [Candidatus Limnocylindrales bacterium]|nr:hypothetical protein [Candidatus Limnocylindrales bacterium]